MVLLKNGTVKWYSPEAFRSAGSAIADPELAVATLLSLAVVGPNLSEISTKFSCFMNISFFCYVKPFVSPSAGMSAVGIYLSSIL
jgi:hypothetical protein